MSAQTHASHHRLAPMFEPRSIALVGASQREGSVGRMMADVLRGGGYAGEVHCVNPRYQAVGDYACLPSIADLPEAPDLAVLSVAAHRMEATMAEAIERGARAAVVFDPCFFEGDGEPRLLDRLKAMAREARLPVCGGNGMGFSNLEKNTCVSFQAPVSPLSGSIAAVCHSGSVYALLVNCTGRYRFNLITSPGQEINLTAAETIDYALELESTRVIVLFLESVRDPERFVAAVDKAHERGVPVVVNKVARTAASAALAATHSGAIAGSESAFEAMCERHGVIRTNDLDEMMATAQILAMEARPGEGGFAAVLDSGGLREQMIDLSHDIGLPFAQLESATVTSLRDTLAFGLEAINPLDAAGPLSDDFVDRFNKASLTLAHDPNVALMAHELFADDHLWFYPDVIDGLKSMAAATGKPHVLVTSLGVTENAATARGFVDAGIPVINGTRPLLMAAKAALAWRDFQTRNDDHAEVADVTLVHHWATELREMHEVDEIVALGLLADFGVPTVAAKACHSADQAVAAANSLGYPVVLKTAQPGVHHKSDVDGVKVGLGDSDGVAGAYNDLAARLGPRVVVAAMAGKGIELGFGLVRDAQFGPVVVVSAGGVLIEVLEDRAFALPPFGVAHAHRLLDRLRISRLFDGVRGRPGADRNALATALSRFSVVAAALGDVILEMDVNPVIAGPDGVAAVDALIVASD